MTLRKAIGNYENIDRCVRIVTSLYFLLLVVLILPTALNVADLGSPMLYRFYGDFEYDAIIDFGQFAIVGCVLLLPIVFIMPFERFNGLYGVFKYCIYVVIVFIALLFMSSDAMYFEDFGYNTEYAAMLYHNVEFILDAFFAFCIVIPFIRSQLSKGKDGKCQMKT